VLLSLFKLVYKMTYLDIRLVQRPGTSDFDLYLEGAATFLRLPKLAATLDGLPAGTNLHVHVDKLTYIDHSCLDLLASWESQNAERGSTLVVQWDGLVARYRGRTTADLAA